MLSNSYAHIAFETSIVDAKLYPSFFLVFNDFAGVKIDEAVGKGI